MPQLFLILEEGNTALLTRVLGDIQTPRFASQGLLSTIASWCMESCGHELRVIASTNVRVVYRRFDNHLLFVLVTSNLLLQTELLQLHLETLYDVLLLLLGSSALVLDTSAKISVLRSKLKAPDVQRAVDSLVADDTLVPCILMPVPQLVGLPLRDKASLQSALTKVLATTGCQHAAVISEGYYLAATHGWWTALSPREQLLVQHLVVQHANHHSEGAPPELLLHQAKRHYQAPLRLRVLRLYDAVLLAALFESGGPPPPPLQDYEDRLRSHLQGASHALERPLWLSPPVPQFSAITFDLALVVVHSPPSAMLLWGHGGGAAAVQQGFNPLVSPSLRKQIGSSASPIVARLSYRPPSEGIPAPGGCGGGDGLQLFFRSSLDTLVSFVLQTWPQMPAPLQAALQDRKGSAASAPAGGVVVASIGAGSAGGGAGTDGGGAGGWSGRSPPHGAPRPIASTTTAASTPPSSIHDPGFNRSSLQHNLPHHHHHHHHHQPAQPTASPGPAIGQGLSTPPPPLPPQPSASATAPPPPRSAGRGPSPASRLGLGAIRRISSSALSGSVPGAARLQALFGRSSSASTAARGADGVAGAAAADGGGGSSGSGNGGVCQEEPLELGDVPYEEVHSVVEGTRLLALLDRSSRAAAGGPHALATGVPGATATSAAVGGAGTGPANQDVVDVFVAFPKRVGRAAALEAANTLRATYLMAYHDDDD